MRQKLQLAASALTLEGIDGLEVPDLVAFVGPDERPLRGLAGLVDWRLCGALTRAVKAELFRGTPGDSLLTVSGGLLPVRRIFLFASGPAGAIDWIERAFQALVRAGGRRVATALPGRDAAPIAVAARAFVQAARDAGVEELVLLHADVRAADRALAVAAESLPDVRLGA